VKRPLGKQRRRWEDNIRMDLKEMVWEGLDRVYLVEDIDKWRDILITVMNLLVP
jgi:hypothetical protein